MLNGYALSADLSNALDGDRDTIELDELAVSGPQIVAPFLNQISGHHRDQAAFMAQYYEIFFLIENFIRDTISESLAEVSANWWDERVPQVVKDAVKKVQQRERDAAHTPRARDPLHYTTFGELSEIVKANWDVLGQIFNSQKAFERCMADLNTLRGPIAHCSGLAEDEVVRLYISVRNLFRIMG